MTDQVARRFALGLFVLAFGLRTPVSSAQITYRRAEIDSTGQLRLVLSSNQVIAPPRDSGQVGVEQPALSRDHQVAGWLVLHPNCCTSYPIPLALELRRIDGRRTTIGNALPIWQWAFSPDGRSVVIRQRPVHGAAPEHYELREVQSGRVLAVADIDPTDGAVPPSWARAVIPNQPTGPPLSNQR